MDGTALLLDGRWPGHHEGSHKFASPVLILYSRAAALFREILIYRRKNLYSDVIAHVREFDLV